MSADMLRALLLSAVIGVFLPRLVCGFGTSLRIRLLCGFPSVLDSLYGN